jgi:hypothetical protein
MAKAYLGHSFIYPSKGRESTLGMSGGQRNLFACCRILE